MYEYLYSENAKIPYQLWPLFGWATEQNSMKYDNLSLTKKRHSNDNNTQVYDCMFMWQNCKRIFQFSSAKNICWLSKQWVGMQQLSLNRLWLQWPEKPWRSHGLGQQCLGLHRLCFAFYGWDLIGWKGTGLGRGWAAMAGPDGRAWSGWVGTGRARGWASRFWTFSFWVSTSSTDLFQEKVDSKSNSHLKNRKDKQR